MQTIKQTTNTMLTTDQQINARPMISDPFLSDDYRKTLAVSNSLDRLSETYLPGVLPELPNLSSEALWAEMANYESVPDFRLRRLRQVANRLPKKGRVLDIGSGWGEIIPMVMEAPGREYVAMDFSEIMLQRLASKYPTVRTIHGGIDAVSDQFDAIMALEVCEHIPATKIMKFYADVRKSLAKGGKFLVTVPLYENLKSLTLQCPNCHQMHNRMGHVRSYTPELITKELKLGGFDVLELSFIYMNFQNGVAGELKRIVINRARKLAGLGEFVPLNAVIVAHASN